MKHLPSRPILFAGLLLFCGTIGCRSTGSAAPCNSKDHPEQTDRDNDGVVDECDVLVTPLGVRDEPTQSRVAADVPAWSETTIGLLAVYNGTTAARAITARTLEPVEWLTLDVPELVNGGGAVTVSATYVPGVLEAGSEASAVIVVGVGGEAEETVRVDVRVGEAVAASVCRYFVRLNQITVVARQNFAFDGFALEPLVEVNAVGLGRTTSPPRGTHVLRVGQSVRPGVIFARGVTTKGNAVNVTVIADVDEIDLPPVNPDDLRNQGQSGVAQFRFECSGRQSQIQIIPVPVIGNPGAEGNGVVEVEVEVVWDP